MSRLTPAIIVAALVAATAASAQTGGTGSGSGTGTGTDGLKSGVWPAPVGHRQPSQLDIRSGGGSTTPSGADAEEKALDKKIKSICKGC